MPNRSCQLLWGGPLPQYEPLAVRLLKMYFCATELLACGTGVHDMYQTRMLGEIPMLDLSRFQSSDVGSLWEVDQHDFI